MLISELIAILEQAKVKYGDLPMRHTYWCDDCDDEHLSEGYRVDIVDADHGFLTEVRLGEEDIDRLREVSRSKA